MLTGNRDDPDLTTVLAHGNNSVILASPDRAVGFRGLRPAVRSLECQRRNQLFVDHEDIGALVGSCHGAKTIRHSSRTGASQAHHPMSTC